MEATITVEHGFYGCDTGCCGHRLTLEGAAGSGHAWVFEHATGDVQAWAEERAREEFPTAMANGAVVVFVDVATYETCNF